MKNLWKFLQGKKTYLATAGAALSGIAAFANGDISAIELALTLFGAGGMASVRSGVSSEVKKLKGD